MKAGDCKHFRGIQHDACSAGVVMKSVRDESGPVGRGYRWPCLTLAGQQPCAIQCPKKEPISADDVADFWRRADEMMGRVDKCREAIIATGLNVGRIDCPACDGKQALKFSVASNGHVHAVCATTDCVRWME